MAHSTEGLDSVTTPAARATADELRGRLIQELPGFLNDRFSELGQTISFGEYGVDLRAVDGTDPESSVELVSVQVNHVERAEVNDLQLSTGLDARSAVLQMRLFGTIIGMVDRYDQDASEAFDTVLLARSYSNDFLDVEAEARWDGHWNLKSVIAIDTATITVLPSPARWREDYDWWSVEVSEHVRPG